MTTHHRYCAFCRSPRAVYAKKHVGFLDVALCFTASITLGYLLWQDLDPRALVVFVATISVSEVFILFRRRLSMACTKCGFNPLIYRRSPERAALEVKAFMSKRREDPLAVMRTAPKLPSVRKRVPPRAAATKPSSRNEASR